MKTLHLTLKKKWFDMIASGEKKEEYRELKPYWERRLVSSYENGYRLHGSTLHHGFCILNFSHFETVVFTHGYGANAPSVTVECKGISIGKARPEWSDNWPGEVFIIKLGDMIKTPNS